MPLKPRHCPFPTLISLIPQQHVHFWRKLRVNSCISWSGLQRWSSPVPGFLPRAHWDVVSEALSCPHSGDRRANPGHSPSWITVPTWKILTLKLLWREDETETLVDTVIQVTTIQFPGDLNSFLESYLDIRTPSPLLVISSWLQYDDLTILHKIG